jgi:predicted Fe-Mo cluster-binding NifX family protein
MENMIMAFASDDGKNYTGKHFGDAEYYLLYEFTNQYAELQRKLKNTSISEIEESHGDPLKAGSVVEMLQKENVKVVVAAVFGPNIKRIKRQFVCILENEGSISDSIPLLMNKFPEILEMWNKGEARNHINLKDTKK